MLIDFHTHTFPDKIAASAISKLAATADTRPHTNGTSKALTQATADNGLDYSVVLPIATKPSQTNSINERAVWQNRLSSSTRLISLGTIHPDNEDYSYILKSLRESGIIGIKIHPVYQRTFIDDERFMNIIACAESLNMFTVAHGGYDIGFPGLDLVSPEHVSNVMKKIRPKHLILAHMGGWGCWDEVENTLLEDDFTRENIYLDTAFCLRPEDDSGIGGNTIFLDNEQFVRIVKKIGAHRVLFGTDSPWSDQGDSLKVIKKSGLSPDELSLILGENAAKILGLPIDASAGSPS
ncbi:MAG: amidohydrolase family protein [Lachnospiraceae bacterium]|nr:amidohydrolase family protein [Lachnospiraceae bacterium]